MSPKRETNTETTDGGVLTALQAERDARQAETSEIKFPVADATNPYAVFFPDHDVRKSNPSLHLLYVKWAVMHLSMLDRMLAEISNCSNTNMGGPYAMLLDARTMLVKTNTAYADAADMLLAAKGIDPSSPSAGILINDDLEG